ncbi:DUF2254 domain-containing protein [Jeotgalibacillus soli]|uniref:DUF2254 domain-containing protein n=1 Tax=Jeotgalibacillus soli TaxID=889306 RepID=A0A0C2W0C9_9BACL|nr:DUF2254 domain-containing protein [Jeotgalibacillus soli]KIL49643.1 hypothetical protein KP78_11110 [Jeotgalibacillus soli]
MVKGWVLKLKDKVWLIPAIYSLLAAGLAGGVAAVDIHWSSQLESFLPPILLTSVPLAQTILVGLSASLLTMTTFTFSTIMVVLTTYSSQYSPRTVKNFITDQLTLRVLGVFMGGFIYPTLSLILMRESQPDEPVIAAAVGVVLATICLVYFAVFIHQVATSIQVSSLIEQLSNDADRVIDYYLNLQKKDKVSLFHEAEWKVPDSSYQVQAGKYGYIQFVNYDALLALAKKHKLFIRVNMPIGSFVHRMSPLLTVYVDSDRIPEVKEIDLCGCFMVGRERDIDQDPIFAFQKMVEVALRAISPGINDPNTANDCIRHLGRLLGNISHLPTRDWVCIDSEKVPYIRFSLQSYEEILHGTFYQLRHYGKEDVSVIIAMLDALQFAAEGSPLTHRKTIVQMRDYVLETIDMNALPVLDQQLLQHKKEGTV